MFLIAVLAAQYAGTFDLYDTTRIDARSSLPVPIVNISATQQGRDVLAGDLMTTPTARLRLSDRRTDYSLGYSPTLTLANMELGLTPQALHSGYAAAGWHNRDVRLSLTETATFGQFNSTFLYTQAGQTPVPPAMGAGATGGTTTGGAMTAATTGPTSQSGAPANTIDFGSTSSAANLAVVASHRTTVMASAGYLTSGGLTTTAKLVLPEQYGPLGTLAVSYAPSRGDNLSTIAIAQQVTTSGLCAPLPGQPFTTSTQYCVINTPFVQIQEAIRHALSPVSSISVSVGAFASEAQTLYVKEAVINPSIAISYNERLSARANNNLVLSAGMTPTVDIRTGLPVNRGQAAASLSDRLASRATITFMVALVQSLPYPVKDPYALTDVTGGVDTQFHVDRQLDVGVGVQTLWQNQGSYGNLASTIGYVNVTARLSTLHF